MGRVFAGITKSQAIKWMHNLDKARGYGMYDQAHSLFEAQFLLHCASAVKAYFNRINLALVAEEDHKLIDFDTQLIDQSGQVSSYVGNDTTESDYFARSVPP